VIDLYNRVPPNAKVIVMNRDGTFPTGLTLPPPQPRRETPRQSTRVADTPDPLVVAPVVAPPLPARLPIAPDLLGTPPATTPATPATAAPIATAPVVPAPQPVTPVCVPTAAKPCPVN
jgi:hypothetical protein